MVMIGSGSWCSLCRKLYFVAFWQFVLWKEPLSVHLNREHSPKTWFKILNFNTLRQCSCQCAVHKYGHIESVEIHRLNYKKHFILCSDFVLFPFHALCFITICIPRCFPDDSLRNQFHRALRQCGMRPIRFRSIESVHVIAHCH